MRSQGFLVLLAAVGCGTAVAGRAERVVGEAVTPFAATLAFLTQFEDAFGVREPAAHLRTTHEERDELGMTHLRLQQVEREVPVQGGEIVAHYGSGGELRSIDSTYISGLERVDVTPQLAPEEALAIAERDLGASGDGSAIEVDTPPELVIRVPSSGPRSGIPSLAYHVDLRSRNDLRVWMDYAVDARTGDVVESYNKVSFMLGSGAGVAGATSAIQVSPDPSGFRLVDTTRTPNGIATYDAKHTGIDLSTVGGGAIDLRSFEGGLLMIPGTANLPGDMVTSGSATAGWDPAAVDAHAHAGTIYDFYRSKFDRKGIDGADGQMISSVHVLKGWNAAAWTGRQMAYGDGDGVLIRSSTVSLFVAGHEITHGVTQATSNLGHVGQPGALNEAISDVFGAMIEHYGRPDWPQNWCFVDDIFIPDEYQGKCQLDFVHPGSGLMKLPAHMSEYRSTDKEALADLGGIHINTGIIHNVFYLMTMGGKNDVSNVEVAAGIGWEKAAQVWYRTNTHYLTSTSGFKEAARANLTSADDLGLSQNDKSIIQCAWIAVGVLDGSCGAISSTDGEPGATAAPGGASSGATPESGGASGIASSDGAPSSAARGCSAAATASGGRPNAPFTMAALGMAVVLARRRRIRSAIS